MIELFYIFGCVYLFEQLRGLFLAIFRHKKREPVKINSDTNITELTAIKDDLGNNAPSKTHIILVTIMEIVFMAWSIDGLLNHPEKYLFFTNVVVISLYYSIFISIGVSAAFQYLKAKPAILNVEPEKKKSLNLLLILYIRRITQTLILASILIIHFF
jgi:hypothetical protein